MSEQDDEQSSGGGWSRLEELRNQPINSPPESPSVLMSLAFDFSSLSPLPTVFISSPPPATSVLMSPPLDFSPPPTTSVLMSPQLDFSPSPTTSVLMSTPHDFSPPPATSVLMSPPLDFSPPPTTSVLMSPQLDFSPSPTTSVLMSPPHDFSPPPTPSVVMSPQLDFSPSPTPTKPVWELRGLTVVHLPPTNPVLVGLPPYVTDIHVVFGTRLYALPKFILDLLIDLSIDLSGVDDTFVAFAEVHHAMPNSAAMEIYIPIKLGLSSPVQLQEFVNSYTNAKLESRRQHNQIPQPARSSPQPVASRDVGEMGQLLSSESLVSVYRSNLFKAKKKNKIDTLKRKCISIEDVLQRIVEILKEDDLFRTLPCLSRKPAEQDCCLLEERSVKVTGDMTLNLRSQCQSSPWPIDLPHGREIVQLDSSDQQSLMKFDATNNGAHVVEPYQNFPTVYHPEKENARDKSKRKYGNNSVLTLQDLQPHFGIKREDAAKSLDISIPTLKRICRQHGIRRWPFQQERKKGRSMEVISPSMHEKLDSRPQCIEISLPARSSPQILALPDGGEMVQLDSSEQQSLVEFDVTNNGAHLVTTASHSDEKSSRETLKRKCETEGVLSFEDLQQHFGGRRDDAAKALGVSVSTVKRICRQHGILRWPSRKKNNVSKPNYIPLEPKRDKNASSTCKTPTDGQAETGNEMVGHLQEQNGVLPDFIEGPNLSNIKNGSKEKNIEAPTFQDSFPGNYPAMDYLSISSTYKESGEAGGSSELAFQPKELIAYPNTNVGSSKDLRNFSTSAVEAFIEGHVSESIGTVPSCSDPVPTQAMTTIPHIMPHLTERHDITTVEFKAKYKHDTIRFDLSLTSGIVELKEEVTKRLELELGSFNVKYLDKDNEWVLIACDADVRDCFKLSSSSGNQTVRLSVRDKVTKSKNSCKSCRGLESKRS